MKIYLPFFFIFQMTTLFPKAPDSCGCAYNLNHMIQKVSKNYAGYSIKVNPQTEKSYNLLVDSLRKKAIATEDLWTCYKILDKYRSFFYDKHLQLSTTIQDPENMPFVNAVHGAKWTSKSVKTYLNENVKKLDPIEGIWQGKGYELGVIYNSVDSSYHGIILKADNNNWKEGMQKFSCRRSYKGYYRGEYLDGSFKKNIIQIKVLKNYLELDHFGIYRKSYPIIQDTISKTEYENLYAEFSDFQFKYLNDSTLYFRLKTEDLAFKLIVDSTLASHTVELNKVSQWILDFRGNRGGSSLVLYNILPYLYTRPFITDGDRRWMSVENTAKGKEFALKNRDLMDSGIYKGYLMEEKYGEENPDTWLVAKSDTMKFDTVLPNPKRVAILSDRYNSSSGEWFLQYAHGLSDKVIIFGENSGGFMDYGDLFPYSMPCDKFSLEIPTVQSSYVFLGISYDREGYPPDVKIPQGDPDWVKFVMNYWTMH